jgi:hypothetical protein
MTDLRLVTIGAQLAAAGAAVMLARRRAEHVPAAGALVLLAVASVAQLVLALRLPPPSAEPYEGPARVLVYLDGAVVLGAAVVTPALALAVFLAPEWRRRAVTVVGAAWLVASVVLAALYPSPLVRGDGLQRVYLAIDLIGLFVAVAALARWARWARARASPGSAHAVAIGLVVLDGAILVAPFSPWRGSIFAGRYDVVQILMIVLFMTAAVAQGVLWRFSPPR